MKNGGNALHLFWGARQYLDLSRKRCPEIGKSKSDISQEQKLKTCMYHHAIPLLEQKPKNIILHFSTNDAPYKSDTDILKDLKDFILEKSPRCKQKHIHHLQFVRDENAKKKKKKT